MSERNGLKMFEVEALQRGFLGRKARLRAIGGDTRHKVADASIEAPWLDHLRNAPPLATGETIVVTVPAFVDLKVGQIIRIG